MKKATYDKFCGVLIGGAVGDALGAPIEFMFQEDMEFFTARNDYNYFSDLYLDDLSEFTDDTQMTLFTAEGILSYELSEDVNDEVLMEHIHASYIYWLRTQNLDNNYGLTEIVTEKFHSDLISRRFLHRMKAPGMTCISSLRNAINLGKYVESDPKKKPSSGCGGVMRAAPFGMVYDAHSAYQFASDSAKLTHLHPNGFEPAGLLAWYISHLLQGYNPNLAAFKMLDLLRHFVMDYGKQYPEEMKRTTEMIRNAVHLAKVPGSNAILARDKPFGEGWTGEEAFAIALYSVLSTRSFEDAVERAVWHDGDSDSTGAIAGNIAGAVYGRSGIPTDWIDGLENADILDEYSTYLWRIRHD